MTKNNKLSWELQDVQAILQSTIKLPVSDTAATWIQKKLQKKREQRQQKQQQQQQQQQQVDTDEVMEESEQPGSLVAEFFST